MTYQLGGLTFGGKVIMTTPTELTILLPGEWATIRIPRPPKK